MKKILITAFILFLLTGCTSQSEELICTINGKEAIFTLKNGMIETYTLDNQKQSQSSVDEINGTYFTSSTNDEEGKETLKTYVNSLGGSCNF